MNRKVALTLSLAVSLFALYRPATADPSTPPQIVAIDACDPTTFNAALGPDFCRNVTLAALGQAVTLSDLFSQAAAGTPNPGWDFSPDTVSINWGKAVSVVNQGGEPHTFTEVKQFGGGFIPGLNDGQDTVRECVNGFANPKVSITRVLQGSQLQVTGLSKGTHYFQCCIHPWMRTKVIVK
jgi:plastocyanin